MSALKKVKDQLSARPFELRFVYFFYWFFKLYVETFLRLLLGRYRKQHAGRFNMPFVLQLPITYKCNCDCIMCGMHSMQGKKDFTPEQLKKILSNSLFKKIKYVGLNGGEPFLINLTEYVDVLIESLPNLTSISIISNGILTNRMLSTLKNIKAECANRKIKVNLSISIDAIGETHDTIRGFKGAFKHATQSYLTIKKDMHQYCDSLGAICTITKFNIENINEIDVWAKKMGVSLSYNIATVHERLLNVSRLDNFSVFADPQKQHLTAEFFYSKFIETKSKVYYALYRFAKDKKRISLCDFRDNGITITPDGQLAYCATKSKAIGDGIMGHSMDIYKDNLAYRKELTDSECSTCSHYTGRLSLKGTLEYNKELLDAIGNPFGF